MTGGRIMVVGADRRLRQARSRALSRGGYQVSRMATLEAASEAARADGPDVLVIDADQPELLGGGLARLPAGTGVLIVAENGRIGAAAEAAGMGMHSFLTGRCSPARLRRAATEAVARVRQTRDGIRSQVLTCLGDGGLALEPEAGAEHLVGRIVELAASGTGADYAALNARDEMTGASATLARTGQARQAWEQLCREMDGAGSVLVDESMGPHPLLPTMRHAGATALISAPVTVLGQRAGALCVVRAQAGAAFSERDRGLVCMLARWSGLVIENSRLVEQIRSQCAKVDRLVKEVAAAQENERRRVAVEIHDGVAQWMVGASYSIRACSSLAAESRLHDLERELATTRQTIQRSIRELRRAIADLRPLPLEEMGLTAAVHQATEALSQEGIHCSMVIEGKLPPLTAAEENTIYWMVQEMLTNIKKHSGAGQVDISMQFGDGVLAVEVRDDGRGFSPPEMERQSTLSHMGLVGMRERAELLGGRLVIDSASGRGTSIRFAFPVTAQDTAGAGLRDS